MRVSRLNEDRLIEVRHRKYLNELLDFCLYESFLNEETAEDYFDWLLPRVLKKVPDNWTEDRNVAETDVDEDGNSRVFDNRFDKYEELNNNQKEDILADLGNKRFQACKDEQGDNAGVVEEYFEGGFDDFKKKLEKTYFELQKQAAKQGLDSKAFSRMNDCFNYYCDLFVKDASKNKTFSPSPYWSVKANWADKKSSKDLFDKKGTVNNLENGKSWNSTPDPKWQNPSQELERYRRSKRTA